eukprot:ANDGO_07340.mRNA.1 hypothetical protein
MTRLSDVLYAICMDRRSPSGLCSRCPVFDTLYLRAPVDVSSSALCAYLQSEFVPYPFEKKPANGCRPPLEEWRTARIPLLATRTCRVLRDVHLRPDCLVVAFSSSPVTPLPSTTAAGSGDAAAVEMWWGVSGWVIFPTTVVCAIDVQWGGWIPNALQSHMAHRIAYSGLDALSSFSRSLISGSGSGGGISTDGGARLPDQKVGEPHFKNDFSVRFLEDELDDRAEDASLCHSSHEGVNVRAGSGVGDDEEAWMDRIVDLLGRRVEMHRARIAAMDSRVQRVLNRAVPVFVEYDHLYAQLSEALEAIPIRM